MPSERHHIGFMPVAAEHYPLIRKWLNEPHVAEWWGEEDEEIGFIRDMVEGRDTTRPFLIQLDGKPVGYIQYWHVGHHQNEEWIKDHPWLAELPSEAIGIDLSIGEAGLLSRGVGSTALSSFVERLAADGYRHIIIDPDPKNLRAVRAYEKAGFRPVPYLAGRTGDDVLIMQFEKNAEDAS
ncbi:MAG: GNAT family N-acetyltransferase [Rhizobiaceae bacterium]